MAGGLPLSLFHHARYDTHGNELSITQSSTTQDSYTHAQANHLYSATGSLGLSATYYYDLYGMRIEKAFTSGYPVYYTYLPATTATPLYMAPDAIAGLQNNSYRPLLSENDLHSGQRADYIYLDPGIDNRPIAEVDPYSGNVYVTQTDAPGTIDKVTGPGTSISPAWSATYNPFGDTNSIAVSDTFTAAQNLRMPGQYFDTETGLNYNGFRYYDPTKTRYIEYDPTGMQAGSNPYLYAGGSPFTWSDPNGLLNWAERQVVPDKYVDIAKQVITKFGRGALTQDQVSDIVQSILETISIGDACKFSSINPSGNPMILSSQQDSIITSQIGQISDSTLQQAAQSAYSSAKGNGSVVVK